MAIIVYINKNYATLPTGSGVLTCVCASSPPQKPPTACQTEADCCSQRDQKKSMSNNLTACLDENSLAQDELAATPQQPVHWASSNQTGNEAKLGECGSSYRVSRANCHHLSSVSCDSLLAVIGPHRLLWQDGVSEPYHFEIDFGKPISTVQSPFVIPVGRVFFLSLPFVAAAFFRFI